DAERFGHVVVRAEIEALQHVGLEVARGHHQHRDVAVTLAQLFEHGEAVLLGEHDVEQHDVGLLLEGELQAFLTALRGQDLVALVAEIVGQPVEQPFLVFYDQHPLHVLFLGLEHHDAVLRCDSAGSVSASVATGSTSVNVLPSPTALTTSTRPPWARMIWSTSDNPSPAPRTSCTRPSSSRTNFSKMRLRSAGAIPIPRSATAIDPVPSRAA